MGYTRRQFIASAFEEIGMADYVFDLQPEQLQGAARRLDSMLLDWNARGIRLGPNISATVDVADLDTDMGLPDTANEAVICNLAMKIAPSYGKQVQAGTIMSAKNALNTLYSIAASPPRMRLPATMPQGAGNKPWAWGYGPFIVPEAAPIDAGNAGELEF